MKTVRILGNKQMGVVHVPDPEPKDDLVVVKIMASTICGTEHTYYEGENALPLNGGTGHEGAGLVWAVDKAKHVKVGDHVAIYPTIYENCHRCETCLKGEWQRCLNPIPKRSQMGTHTQYMLVPEYVLMPIPLDMPFETAAMIDDCMGTPYKAIKRLNVAAGETVLITGAGPIGMSALVICKFRKAKVIISDTNPYRLKHAESLGADYILNPATDNIKARIKEITDKRGVDVALECSGVESAQIQCLEALAGGGRMAFLGIKSMATTINPWKHLMHKEVTVIGGWASDPQDHTDLVNMLKMGMPANKIITHRYPIDEVNEAFNKFFSGEAVKVVLNPWE